MSRRASYGNVLLILAQRPDATRIAVYQAWKAMGRQVRRGERGIKVVVPMRLRFGVGTVFDIEERSSLRHR